MKKLIIFVFLLLLLPCFLISCGTSKISDKQEIVVTIYPEYNWITELINGVESEYNITWLNKNGIDYHSYSPSVSDITKIISSDLFIYIGGESDAWVENVLKTNKNTPKTVLKLLDVIENKIDEQKEDYMSGETEEEIVTDEHIWLSIKNAISCVKKIGDELIKTTDNNKEQIKSNLDNYVNKLTMLDNQYEKAINLATKSCIVFGDRFPFIYLFNDYNIDYYAAFVGCSTETTASVKTITTLVDSCIENNIENIAVIETYEITKTNVADTVITECKNKGYNLTGKITLDSMQTKSIKDLDKFTYIGIMEENLKNLKVLLGTNNG